jgi:hypothetical protein
VLSSLFSTISSSLGLSTNFLIAYLLPWLIFFAASGGVLYRIGDPWKLLALDPGSKVTWFSTFTLVAISALAYVFSTLGNLMRELLEGRHVLEAKWLRGGPHSVQRKKLDDLSEKFRKLGHELSELPIARWKMILRRASEAGWAQPQCEYPATKVSQDGYQRFQKVRDIRFRGDLIRYDDLYKTVRYMRSELRANNTTKRNAGELVEDYRRVREILEYAQDAYASSRNEYFSQRQFRFPGVFIERKADAPSAPSNILAATEMGNIARTIRSYALNRYSLDLDVLWSRLQAIVQGKKEFFSSLQDAKTQLDFLVSLCWVTAVFWILWSVLVPLYSHDYLLFGIIMFAGPALTWLWYRLACESYTAFADLMRTSVDLYRFELLDAMNLPRPRDLDDENALWERVAQAIGFEDSDVHFEYKADKKS